MPATWIWRILQATACTLFAGALHSAVSAEALGDGVEFPTEPTTIADFILTDQHDRSFAFGNLRGRKVLVFFGFTHCPTVCPTALFKLKQLTEVMHDTGEAVPTVVVISVDGQRDTPSVMKSYLSAYSEDFIGLTGDPVVVRAIAAQFKAVFFKGLPADRSGQYVVEHTSQIYLVDEQGRLRATFFDSPVESIARATRSIVENPT